MKKEYNTYAFTKKTIVSHKYFFEKLKITVSVTLFFDFIFFIFFTYVLHRYFFRQKRSMC